MLKFIDRCQQLGCLLASSALLLPMGLRAELIQTDDYIYVAVEAEDHDAKDDRWVLTEPGTPAQENDPDGNHSDQASGQSYLELLPDMRVTHADTFGPPTAYWGQGGQGPSADYTLDFPEAGRYYVHMRAYSTGTEDNGIHLGLNGAWPQSGRTMQFCTANRRAWWWSSAQRDAGGNGSCGKEKTIWLDIPNAGTHTVSISAREDGFEIDRFALVKDLSGNTKVCTPKNINDVSCVNGSIESADSLIDMRIRLFVEPTVAGETPDTEEYEVGQSLLLTAKLENLDSFDTATEIVATVEIDPEEWVLDSVDEECVIEGKSVTCELSSLEPTAPSEFEAFVFGISAKVPGAHRIDGSVVALEIDDTPNNDVAATVVDILGDVAQTTDVSLSISSNVSSVDVGESFTATLLASNLGEASATGTSITFGQPNNVEFDTSSLPAGCAGSATIVCDLGEFADGATQSFTIRMMANAAGTYVLPASLSASNDDDASNNETSTLVLATQVDQATTGEAGTAGNTDAGSTTDGTTAGSSTGSGTAGSTTQGESTDGETTDGTSTTDAGASSDDSDSGSAGVYLLMLLTLFLLTGGYRRHQRQYIRIGK